ncbi:MAG: hypothetical protein JRM78_05450 [Nitrososphaerota archaeon]|nr:hypothetical protein [Nitrososphaerota archaeon]MDG7037314.1 hypothetical protein [Nitrososphaerota archaeon]
MAEFGGIATAFFVVVAMIGITLFALWLFWTLNGVTTSNSSLVWVGIILLLIGIIGIIGIAFIRMAGRGE